MFAFALSFAALRNRAKANTPKGLRVTAYGSYGEEIGALSFAALRNRAKANIPKGLRVTAYGSGWKGSARGVGLALRAGAVHGALTGKRAWGARFARAPWKGP